MSSFVRCPRCGAFWAGADVPMNGEFVCLDCITKAAKPRVLNRRVLAIAALAATLLGATTYFALPSRRAPARPAPADDRVASVPKVSEEDGDNPTVPATDEPASRRPERPAEKPRTHSDVPDEPLSLPPSITARPELKEEKPAPVVKAVARRKTAAEPELIDALAAVPEVGLGSNGQTVLTSYFNRMQQSIQLGGKPNAADPTPLVLVRPDLRALPIRTGANWQLNPVEAANLGALSRKLRVYLDTTATPDGSPRPETAVDRLRESLQSDRHGTRPEWLRPEAFPTLLQMLMPEDAAVRRLLVDLLAQVPHAKTTTALAQRAVFDLDDDVRRAAVEALRKRPAEVYRPILLKALRYPWAPAADHAAAALVDLGDRSVVPHLVTMLRQPDPALPETLPNGSRVVREVVRVQHTANCLMCHPPSADGGGPVVGVDPVLNVPPGSQLSAGSATSGASGAGAHNYAGRTLGGSGPPPLIIRADVTFFRQDFSIKVSGAAPPAALPQPIPFAPPPRPTKPRLAAGVWGPRLQLPAASPLPAAPAAPLARPAPTGPQRFDFLVRTRAVTPLEAARLVEAHKKETTYPQREAVLFALRELTGKDAGPTSEAWRELFPRAEIDTQADNLRRQLKERDAVQQGVLLARWREQSGDLHMSAMARLIPDLGPELQDRVRDVLADRLSRGKADVLRTRLGDDDPELRRAAVLACGRKKDKSLVPDLITVLEDAEPADAALIEEALHTLTGEQQDGAAAWRAWWEKQATE
jgi:HEAT repeat protein